MPRHIEALMDNVNLCSVGPFILQQVYEDPASVETTEGERPGRYGTRYIGRKRQSLKVALEVAVRELFDLPRRARAMEALAGWARGSVLELSNHPDRRLNVVCTGEPSLGAVRDYTAAARLEFTAFDIPFWVDKRPSSLSLTTDDEGSGNLYVPGTAAAPVDVSVSVVSGTLTTLSLVVDGETIALSNLSVSSGGVITFTHNSHDDLLIRSGSLSLLSARSAASADDFFPDPGYAAVSYAANTDVAVTFSVRGRWA